MAEEGLKKTRNELIHIGCPIPFEVEAFLKELETLMGMASLLDTYCEKADFVFNLAGVNRPKEQSEFMDGNLGFASKLLDTLKKYHNTCPVMLSSSIQARRRTYFSGDCDQGRKSDSKSNKN